LAQLLENNSRAAFYPSNTTEKPINKQNYSPSRLHSQPVKRIHMLTNFFKIAWRNLVKNKAFSFINILGLAIGIAVCFIIMLFVNDELNYDLFNEKADRTVRIVFRANINGGKIYEGNVMPPVAAALKNDYAEVEEATRLKPDGKPKISYC
jgi:putative ABC transport system permease protein